MKNFRSYAYLFMLMAISAGILSLSGCKKDSTEKAAPSLPPQAGFVMNFNDFSNPGDTLKSASQTDYYMNWGYAYLNVAAWNISLAAGLAVPVASYVEAFKHEAVYHPDLNNWTWSYNFIAGSTTYEAVLTGAIVGDSTSWEMRITKGGAYSNYLWYSGKASVSQSGGYWILTESPENPVNLLKIDWNKLNDGTADIRYTNIKAGVAQNGSFIFYGTTLNAFDRFYQIFNVSNNNLTEIEWSSTQHNGHVKDPLHFFNTAWHCWDNNLQDIVCP